jgi:peptide/nickel transport system substrate-binding protein
VTTEERRTRTGFNTQRKEQFDGGSLVMLTRRAMLRRVLASAGSLLVPGLLPWTSFAQSSSAADRTLKYGMFFPPKHLDPHRETVTELVMLWKNVYESLIDVLDDKPGLQGVLATSWKVEDGGKALVIKLRQGVKFHDGTDFDAEAVKFNFDRIQKINLGPAYILKPIDRVQVIDGRTVLIALKQPFLPMLAGLALVPMISPKSVHDNEVDGDLAQKWYINHGVGTGPYKFETVNLDEQITLSKFAPYWRGWQGQHFEQVALKMVFESSAQRLQLERGDLDIATNFSPDSIPALDKNSSVTVYKQPSVVQYYLRLNNAGGPFAKREVRQALNYAWDPSIIQKALGNLASPSDGPLSKELLAPYAGFKNPYRYDLARAKQLLAQAGYPNGFTTTLYQQKDVDEARVVAEAAHAMLAPLGINLNIQVMPFFDYVGVFLKWRQTKDPTNIPGMATQFRTANFPDPYAVIYGLYYSQAQSGDGRNYTFYSNPQVDDSLSRATQAVDVEQAYKLYANAAQLIADDAADLFAYKRTDVLLMRRNVKGFKFNKLYWKWVYFYRLSRG